jgi:hypothetical protein
MITRRPDTLTMIQELTQPTQNRELYHRKRKPRYHTTNNPPLLAQLDESAMPSNNRIDGAGTIAGSRPSASLDAIDTANRIHTQALQWLERYQLDTSGNTIDHIRRLGPTAAASHCHQPNPPNGCCVAHDIRRWWTWARITTGWDQPAWAPDNTCPICTRRGTLRIRLADKLATCIDDTCRTTWDEATIGLLADHIRTENGEQQAS